VAGTFLAGVIVLYVATSMTATWGSPPVWPVIVGVAGMLAVCTVAFTLGALFPGRFTAPIVAVGLMIVTLVAFRQAVGDNGGSSGAVGVLSPDGGVPGDDWGLFYPVSVGVPIVQVMFMLGVVLAAIGVLGLSPRTGGVGWRGALSAVAAGGARLRAIAVSAFAVGVALAVAAFALAETANVSDATSTLQIPAIDNTLAGSSPIPYTPVCSPAGFQVCVHPAYRSFLSQVSGDLGSVVAQVPGAPGVPASAREILPAELPQWLQGGTGSGRIAGATYEFVLSSAIGWSSTPAGIKDGLQQDFVTAIITGGGKTVTMPDGSTMWASGTPAQQAVVNGILTVLGTPPGPVPQVDGNSPDARRLQQQQAQITATAAKFAALPPAARHAWLAANLTALRAGTITLAQVP
jgi:hypothetical protein